MAERKYTLAEAERELARRECSMIGHSLTEIIAAGSADPVRVVCSRCAMSWKVVPANG